MSTIDVCRKKMSDQPNVRIWFREQERPIESTVEGRQRRCRCNLWWQAVPHLRASNHRCSAANSGVVNWRLNEAVAAGRATLVGLQQSHALKSTELMRPGVLTIFKAQFHTCNSTAQAIKSQSSHKSAEAWRQVATSRLFPCCRECQG